MTLELPADLLRYIVAMKFVILTCIYHCTDVPNIQKYRPSQIRAHKNRSQPNDDSLVNQLDDENNRLQSTPSPPWQVNYDFTQTPECRKELIYDK